MLFRHHTSCQLFFFQGKMLTSYSVSIYKRKGGGHKTKETSPWSMGHPTWDVFFYPCALTMLKGGPPTTNSFPFAIQTCLEKFQGLYYEESF